MRRILGLAFAALAATMLLAAGAGPVLAANVQCGDTITQDVKLDSNLDCPGDGFVVGAPNVTIDLNGHRIWGSGAGYGIRNFGTPKPPPCAQDECWPKAGFAGLTVVDGTIGGFANAIYAVGDHETFRRLHVRGTLAACCYSKNNYAVPDDIKVLSSRVDGSIQAGTNSVVQGNRVVGGNLSIPSGTAARNVVGTTASGQFGAVSAGGSVVVTQNVIGGALSLRSDARVDRNDISGGIYIRNVEGSAPVLSISENRIHASKADGISIFGNPTATIAGNRIYANAGNGISATGSTVCTNVIANIIYANAGNGIYATSSKCLAGRRFADNSIWGNGADGLYVVNDHAAVVISGNSARRNGGDGIHVDHSSGGQMNPFPSPDGQKVVFQDSHGLSWDIYSANSDGTGVKRLTDDPGQDTKPQWSPDGSMIAFVSDRGGSQGLYVMRPDGSGVTRLASLEILQDPDEPIPFREKTFAWSLDSKFLLFGNDRLYSVNADGTDLKTVGDGRLVVNPRWTPDGSKIVFEAGPWFPTLAITTYIVNTDGTGLRYADPATDFPNGTVGGAPIGVTAFVAEVLINPFVTLAGNAATENKALGIDAVPGVVDGGGNRAWRNGNPAQCVSPALCGRAAP